MSEFTTNVIQYWNSGHPILAVQSHEEGRVLATLKAMTKEKKIPFYEWSMSQGFYAGTTINTALKVPDPAGALAKIKEFPERSIIVMADFNTFFANQMVIRLVRDLLEHLEETGKMLFIVNP